MFAAFVFFEERARAPLIPLALFRLRLLAASSGGLLLTGATFLAMLFFTSLYFQQLLGYSALETGLLFLPMGFAAIFGAVLAQGLIPRFGTRAVVSSGAILLILGLALLATVGVHEAFWPVLSVATVLVGLGLPLSFVPANITGVTAVSSTDVGIAAGLLNSAFQIGAGLGIAVVTTVATTTSTQALASSHGADLRHALSSGDAHAFAATIAFPVLGILVAIMVLRSRDGRDAANHAGGANDEIAVIRPHDLDDRRMDGDRPGVH
jgi:predicted MFS family arabinose efflux permease